MWSHFILSFSVLAIFIECRPEQNNNKIKAANKDNSYEEFDSEEFDLRMNAIDDYYKESFKDFLEQEEKKVI